MDIQRPQSVRTPAWSRRQQVWCAYTGYIVMLVFFIAFGLLAGFIPPPDPSDSPEEIAERFRDDTTRIRLAMVIGIFVSALLLLWGGAVAVQMRRIEGRASVFVYAWIGAIALLLVEFIYPCAWWGVAAYRPDDDPEIIQRFNDMAWLAFVGVACTVVLQAVILGALVLLDTRAEPIYPRWFGYFNFWCALLIAPAGVIFFFKDGPFAWNGVMSFWVVLIAYCAWTFVVSSLTARAINRQADEEIGATPEESSEVAVLRAELAELRTQVTSVARAEGPIA